MLFKVKNDVVKMLGLFLKRFFFKYNVITIKIEKKNKIKVTKKKLSEIV